MEPARIFHVYTDGACKGNPGKGGWAFAVVDPITNQVVHQACGKVIKTTNNRMELSGVLEAFKYLETTSTDPDLNPSLITPRYVFYVDSKYVVDGITSWIVKWKNNGWLTSTKKPVLNEELWKELDYFKEIFKGRVTWQWVRGHAGNTFNELVDVLAQTAAT